MGCTPACFGRRTTVKQRLMEREEALKEADRELIRILDSEQEAIGQNMSKCEKTVRVRGDLQLAELYAIQVMQHRDNYRLLEIARMQISNLITCLHQVGQQHTMGLVFRGFGQTLRRMNAHMPAYRFERIAKSVGIQLGAVEEKRQRMKDAVETHVLPAMATGGGDGEMSNAEDAERARAIRAIVNQFRLVDSTARVEEIDESQALVPLDDEDDADVRELTLRLQRIQSNPNEDGDGRNA